MIGAARLDPATYEEVEADPGAVGQALLVVLLSGVASGIGAAGASVPGILFGTVVSILAWLFWAGVTAVIGTRVLPEPQTESDLGELLRTIGFSSSPGLLRIFAAVPAIGGLVNAAVSVWMLVAMVIAVRQALDYRGTGRAIAVCGIGWLLYVGAIAFFLFGLGVAN